MVPPETLRRSHAPLTAISLLALLAYSPFFGNGFIADDWLKLERAPRILEDPMTVFEAAPEAFRATTQIALTLLWRIFGFESTPFYWFAFALHGINVVLLYALVRRLGLGRSLGLWSALLFSVIQNPHETLAWLTAMKELFLTLFGLLSLLAWADRRPLASTTLFLGALFSMESAVVLIVAFPCVDLALSRRPDPWRYAVLGIPLLLFAAVFLARLPDNDMVTHGFYSFSAGAPVVLLLSLHKLAFPYLYLALLLAWLGRQKLNRGHLVAATLTALALTPYIFLTYQNHVPSRHLYLSAVPFSVLLAGLAVGMRDSRWKLAFGLLFVIGNAGYLWIVKDPAMEARAAPTERLREFLETSTPQRIELSGFPSNPWIAKAVADTVPGWARSQVLVEALDRRCPECLQVRWGGTDYTSTPPRQ